MAEAQIKFEKLRARYRWMPFFTEALKRQGKDALPLLIYGYTGGESLSN